MGLFPEPTVDRGRSRISVAKGSSLNFRGRKSNSLMNLCGKNRRPITKQTKKVYYETNNKIWLKESNINLRSLKKNCTTTKNCLLWWLVVWFLFWFWFLIVFSNLLLPKYFIRVIYSYLNNIHTYLLLLYICVGFNITLNNCTCGELLDT